MNTSSISTIRPDRKGTGRSCGNCGGRDIHCNVKKCAESKDGYGFWRPEGAALVTEEVEEISECPPSSRSELI